MPFMDSHCHLDFEAFDVNRDHILEACLRSDIQSIVVPGVKASTWDACLALTRSNQMLRPALGLHPYFTREHRSEDLHLLRRKLTETTDVVAVGEIGLDDTCADFDKQCELFEAQLDLAASLSLPVIMHMRRQHGPGLKRVRDRNIVGGVVHAFSGSLQDASAWVDLGMKIGVGGIITYERAKKTRATVAKLPLESIVLETDAPDMTVQGGVKGRGTPMMLKQIFDVLCEIRPEPPEEIRETIWGTSNQLFGCDTGR